MNLTVPNRLNNAKWLAEPIQIKFMTVQTVKYSSSKLNLALMQKVIWNNFKVGLNSSSSYKTQTTERLNYALIHSHNDDPTVSHI